MNKQIKSGTHEPFAHIVKREKMPWWKEWGVRLCAIALSLVVCAIVIKLVIGVPPTALFSKFADGLFGRMRSDISQNHQFWLTMGNTSILLLIALAITPAFKMRFWNIGAEGQVLIGSLASAWMMITIGKSINAGGDFPRWLTLVVMLAVAMIAGAIWAVIPALFKIKWSTNETLFTLMMNYIAIQLTAFCCTEFWSKKNTSNNVGVINSSGEAAGYGWLPTPFADVLPKISEWLIIILVAVVVSFLMYIYLKYSKQGYELSVVGESENTARYVGINVPKVVLRTMLISGALCGVVGFLLVSGDQQSISTTIVDGRGFTAIMVSWISKFNPFAMAAVAFMFVFLEHGAAQIASEPLPNGQRLSGAEEFSSILTAIIIFFIIGCEFFINYKVVFRKFSKKGA